MAASKPKSVYASDQRQLSVLVAASRTGGTTYTVVWRECLAGEERMRESVLLKGRWTATLNTPAEGIRALVWIARAMMHHARAKD